MVAAAGPARQSRATVAFRIILVIPHVVVLYFLGAAASVVALIGWLCAVFTGRLPDFAAAYLSGHMRWNCRVTAYILLLTDEYPPFVLQDAAYPVRVAVSSSRLNRLAVLFRLVLAIPAAILSMILLSGVGTIVIFIAWLTTLVAGRLPGSLHQAFAAVLRYSTRYYGYLYLLTDTYPSGLFGDKPGSWADDRPGGPGYGGPDAGYGGPDAGYGPPGRGYPQGAGYDAPAGYGGPGYGPPGQSYPQPAGYDTPAGYGGPGYGPPGQGYPQGAGYDKPAGYREPGYGPPGQGYPQPAGYDAPAGYGAPGYGPPGQGYPQPGGYDAPAGYGAPDYSTEARGYREPPPGHPAARVSRHRAAVAKTQSQPASWHLVLSVGAKNLVGLILALGLATSVGVGVSAGSVVSSAMHRSNEINQLNAAIAENNNAIRQNEKAIAQVNSALARITSAHAKLGSQLNLVDQAAQACTSVDCFDSGAVRGASAAGAFERRLRAVAIPPVSAAAERKFASDATRYKQAWAGMGHAVSLTDYVNRAERAAKVGRRFDHDYQALNSSLHKLGDTLIRQAASLNKRTNSLNRQAAALNAG